MDRQQRGHLRHHSRRRMKAAKHLRLELKDGVGTGGFNGEWFGNTLPPMNPAMHFPFGSHYGNASNQQFPVHQAPYRVLPGNFLGGAGLQELMMMNMMWLMKGHGKGSSPESSSWHVPSPDRRKRRKSRKQDEDVEERSEESEKDEAEEGERRPRGRRGPSGSDPSSDPTTPEASESSAHTSEVRSLLRRRARLGQERPKSSLGPRVCIYTTVRVVVVRCLLEKLIMSSHVMCFQYVLFHVMCFQYVLFQTYLETNFTNIIFLTHIAFGDIVALKQGKMTRLKKQNDIIISI